MEVSYKIFNPAGNITALVIGDEYSVEERKVINNKIMGKEPKVEQVGFLSQKQRKLTMAGGEFCGNATRCAALYYIEKKQNLELEIKNNKIKAGINEESEIWCEIPIEEHKIEIISEEIYKVILKGITILIVKDLEKYNNFMEDAKKLIKRYKLDDDAVGVMFTESWNDCIKIFPIVWVKKIDTLFFENACGSGTIAVTMLESWIKNCSDKYNVIQPSGEALRTEIEIKDRIIKRAILKGKIKEENIIKKIII